MTHFDSVVPHWVMSFLNEYQLMRQEYCQINSKKDFELRLACIVRFAALMDYLFVKAPKS
jgi:hypothetical protein